MNEAETRAEHNDPALKAAGWGVVEGSRIRREYQIAPGWIEGPGQRAKQLTADYILEYRNTKLGVIEAKPWDSPFTQGLPQAKNYAGKHLSSTRVRSAVWSFSFQLRPQPAPAVSDLLTFNS